MLVPKTIKEAYDIDRLSRTVFGNKDIDLEMMNVRNSFEKLDVVTSYYMSKGKIQPGYEHVNVHMIFYINIDGKFTRKARLLADGHTIAPPSSITYSIFFSGRLLVFYFYFNL